MSPQAYLDSLQRAADYVELKEGDVLLDAGCGTGLLLSCLSAPLKAGGRYVGLDILWAGLEALCEKACRQNLKNLVSTVQADLSKTLPFADRSFQCVAAHFSVYTLPNEQIRSQVYREFRRVLKPGGRLIVSNPTTSYDARRIIRISLVNSAGKISALRGWLRKVLIYPLALRFGLKHVERQLKSGKWHACNPEKLAEVIRHAGFAVEHWETVYAESGCLVVARKPD